MLGLAGLAFAACSSDDEVTSAGLDGDAVVRVNIVTAGSTRAVTDPVGGNDFDTKVVEVNKIRLKLTAGTGGGDITFENGTEGKTAMQQAKEHVFTGVRNPQKMEIFINDGAEKMELNQVINTKLAAPMYASTDAKDFKLVLPEQSGDKNYTVKTYEVTLKPQHKTALLEFSGIKHAEDNATCAFAKMTFKGIFMNKIAESEKNLDGFTNFKDWNEVIAKGLDGTYVWDEIKDDTDFLTSTEAWPKDNKCYAYNVFGNTKTLPILTLYFDGIETKPGFDFFHGATTGYAAVAKYKLNVDGMSEADQTALGVSDKDPYVKKFVPGYVYRINNIVVPDSAIGPTPAGGEDVNVLVVEVTVNPWKLVSGTVEWN